MDSPEIGFWGGMALLISSITGPGLTTIPLLFQEAGWFTPTLVFVVFGAISGATSLFLVETMSTIHGNESFQAAVEYSTIAHLYLGKRAHLIMQVLLYCALQSLNVSSIIISEQTIDSLLITLFRKTCALSFSQGWTCVSEVNANGSPFNSYILFSFGYLITAAMVLPLSVLSLVQNVKFQLVSVLFLFFVMGAWIVIFAHHGLHQSIPVIGRNQSSLVGFVLNNFAFTTTIPSFVNELSRHVSIHRTIAYPLVTCVILYLIVGLMGAASFQLDPASDILATLSAADQYKALVIIINILFPIAVLITSVPVFAIVMRYNLVRGNLCSNRWAIVWSSLIPWILIIPFQTKGWLVLVMNWSSLIFGSSTNFIIPLVLFLSSKIYPASTIDASGGDLFVLHREDSFTPSRRRSTQVARESREIMLHSSSQDTLTPPRRPTLPPLLIVSSEFDMLEDDSSIQKDSENVYQQASTSNLEPSQIPLRVVYSPTVTRRGSVGSPAVGPVKGSPLPSAEQKDSVPEAAQDPASPTSRNVATASDAERGHLRRNSTSKPVGLSERSDPGVREIVEEPDAGQVFVAFPDTRWFKSIRLAKVMLGIVVCCVLGNLIYTIVETAEGNNAIS